MSRIDDALRIAEAARGVATAERHPAQPGHASTTAEYPSEGNDHGTDMARDVRRHAAPERPFRPAPATVRRIAVEGAKLPDNAEQQARLVTGTSSTASLEQYRRLAALLHEDQVQQQLHTVMITSALPHEGKTLTAVNLALTLSESYARRVLVIDADLRWPSLHTVLGLPNDRGLSEALTEERGELSFTEVSSHLSAMTSGRPGPTPLASLASSRMERVLAECAERFDWVLIDTSPVGVLPDAQVLVRHVGGTILVIGAGSTPAKAIERAVADLGGPDAILGVVLNRVEGHHIPAAGYYGQYGQYGAPEGRSIS